MIGRLMSALWMVAACFCVATVIALAIGGVYVSSNGAIDRGKLLRIVAIAQGREPAPDERARPEDNAPQAPPSMAELAAARSLQMRNVELREQSVRQGLSHLEFERGRLAEEKGRFFREKTGFENRLDERAAALEVASQENVRLILENMKPKQVKEQVLLMLKDERIEEVVSLLAAMPIAKRAKIAGEFKTEEESEKLAEILELMRAGVPEAGIIDAARQQLQQAPAANP